MSRLRRIGGGGGGSRTVTPEAMRETHGFDAQAVFQLKTAVWKKPVHGERIGPPAESKTGRTAMLSTFRLLTTTVVASLGFAMFAAPSFAGECPADKVMANATPPGAMAPKDVTDTVVGSVKLDAYNIPGRELRLRKLVIKKGGVVPWHEHNLRPANIYIESGEVTEYRSNCAVPIVHKAGDVVPEQGEIAHWWKNTGNKTAVLYSADILPPSADAKVM